MKMQVKYEPWGIKKDDTEFWGVQILEGKYAGTVISFNDVELENNSDGVKLDYSIYKLAEGIKENTVSTDPEFNSVMSYVIEDILQKAIDEYENRKNNSSEPNK